jgi:hypothetical protein
LAGIAAAFSLRAVTLAHAAEPHLAADEGIVIYRIPANLQVRSVEFRQLHSRVHFTGWPQIAADGATPTIVKAGFYYLYSFDSPVSNLGHLPNKEPADERGAFQVMPGAVTYIGDWYVTLKRANLAAHLDTIAIARKENAWLEHYPLFVSLVGREEARLPWEQVPAR